MLRTKSAETREKFSGLRFFLRAIAISGRRGNYLLEVKELYVLK
jgi:hypothetical protein